MLSQERINYFKQNILNPVSDDRIIAINTRFPNKFNILGMVRGDINKKRHFVFLQCKDCESYFIKVPHDICKNVSRTNVPIGNCSICSKKISALKMRIPLEDAKKKVYNVHKSGFTYDWTTYESVSSPMVIICDTHGPMYKSITQHVNNTHSCLQCYQDTVMTFEQFEYQARALYGNEYTYYREYYQNKGIPMIITHNTCGRDNNQTPYDHLRGRQCFHCNGNPPLTTESFKEKAVSIHGTSFNYSKTIYVNYREKVIIICNRCEFEFEQIPNNHLSTQQSGCPKCGRESMIEKLSDTLEVFIEKSIKTHGTKFCYDIVLYNGAHSKVAIICNACGDTFYQLPAMHIYGNGCLRCSGKMCLTLEQFIINANIIHNNTYDYSEITEYINNNTKVPIRCKIHGIFEQTPHSHMSGGCGCPKCSKNNYSKKQIVWLNKISEEMNFDIKHAENGGEYTVVLDTPDKYERKKYKLDGCLLGSKIAFEYDGTFWHGYPLIYNRSDINSVTGKTYGELFDRTVEKRQVLSRMGWLVFYVWEQESDEGNIYGCNYFKNCLELFSNYPDETKYNDIPFFVYGKYL